MSELPLPEKILAVHKRLSEAKIPHAFGGALALAYYAEPRATDDIDVNIFTSTDRFGEVASALEPLGVDTNLDSAQLDRDGQCRLWWGRTPLDLFFAYDALHDEMKQESRREPFGSETVPILAPEHLLICKAAFDRTKDWIDIEQMIVGVADLDVEGVDGWLTRILGEADQRKRRFDDLVARYRDQE
jgi:hypothetical protein